MDGTLYTQVDPSQTQLVVAGEDRDGKYKNLDFSHIAFKITS